MPAAEHGPLYPRPGLSGLLRPLDGDIAREKHDVVIMNSIAQLFAIVEIDILIVREFPLRQVTHATIGVQNILATTTVVRAVTGQNLDIMAQVRPIGCQRLIPTDPLFPGKWRFTPVCHFIARVVRINPPRELLEIW